MMEGYTRKNWNAQILETYALGLLTVTASTKDEAISILKIINQYRKYAPSSWHLFVQIPEDLDVFEEHVTCSEISKEPLVSVRVNINGGNGYKFSDVTSDVPRMLVMYSRYDESSKELLEGTPWKLEFEYDECIKGLSGECVPYKEQDEIVHKANQKLGEAKFKIKDIQYHDGCIIDCGRCGICESFDYALVFLRVDDLYKKARFGDKKVSRKLFCLLDENIKEFARWIAVPKEEAKKEIFELSEMFKDFYNASEPVYTWTVVSFSEGLSEPLRIEHVKASKEQIQEYMLSKIDLEGVDVEISHELNRMVYRSCSELGDKKMIWIVEKCLENDIFDLNV